MWIRYNNQVLQTPGNQGMWIVPLGRLQSQDTYFLRSLLNARSSFKICSNTINNGFFIISPGCLIPWQLFQRLTNNIVFPTDLLCHPGLNLHPWINPHISWPMFTPFRAPAAAPAGTPTNGPFLEYNPATPPSVANAPIRNPSATDLMNMAFL